MATNFDPSEFVDDDFQSSRKSALNPFTQAPVPASAEGQRAPTREEVETRSTEMQQKLAELRQVQQELERERATLEELRRRQTEFSTGRQEMLQHLTRGVGLLEEAEFSLRRDAEQMAKSLAEFREHLAKIQAIQEASWTKDNLNVELTRALTMVENARMEWNSARLKFPILSGAAEPQGQKPEEEDHSVPHLLHAQSFSGLCRLGLALTWPLVLAALAIFVVLLIRR